MPSTRFVRRALTLAGAAGLALAVGLPASAAPAPAAAPTAAAQGWRVLKTLGPFAGDGAPLLAAASPTDAWYTWTAYGYNGKYDSSVLHWNGKRWESVPVPASMDADVHYNTALGVVSPDNVWLFNGAEYPVTSALRWNGRNWHRQAIPKWVTFMNLSGELTVQADAFSATNLWLFSEGQDKFTHPDHYAARYNGRSWSKVSLPVMPDQVSAVSPTDIWILGQQLSNLKRNALAHWNGSRWSTVALPAIRVAKGAVDTVADLAAAGPASVWTVNYLEAGPAGAVTTYLLHWNGKAWSRVYLKYRTSYAFNLAPDGQGGIWMSAAGPAPAYQWRFYHRTASGQWSENAVGGSNQVNLLGTTWIPGTRSLWATEETFPKVGTDAEILKYGP